MQVSADTELLNNREKERDGTYIDPITLMEKSLMHHTKRCNWIQLTGIINMVLVGDDTVQRLSMCFMLIFV